MSNNTITAAQFKAMAKATGKGGRVSVNEAQLKRALANADGIKSSSPIFTSAPKIKINIKPMSVNRAYRGRQVHTDEYKDYISTLLGILPVMEIPKPPYRVYYEFAFSNKSADVDGPIKVITDSLQKIYGFNDKLIYEMNARKVIVPKGEEFFTFKIEHLPV